MTYCRGRNDPLQYPANLGRSSVLIFSMAVCLSSVYEADYWVSLDTCKRNLKRWEAGRGVLENPEKGKYLDIQNLVSYFL